MFLLAKNNSDEGAIPNVLIQLFKNYNELNGSTSSFWTQKD